MILSFSCNDVCCYLSDLSLPTCLILSDKHIRGVSTETGPDVWLDRLPSENDDIRRRQPSRHSQADRHHGCALVGDVVVGAKGKYLQSKCCESCFQSKRFWLPILALTPIFGSQKLTNYYCFTQYGTEKEGSVSDSEYKVTQFCLSFSSRNMRGTVRYTPGAQDTANMVSGRVLINTVHTSLALPLVNKPPLLYFFTLLNCVQFI